MSGGVLDADNSLTVSGALSHSADITIDVADTKTLTYSGTAISLGANTLTLSGGGSFVSGGLTLNNADSKLSPELNHIRQCNYLCKQFRYRCR